MGVNARSNTLPHLWAHALYTPFECRGVHWLTNCHHNPLHTKEFQNLYQRMENVYSRNYTLKLRKLTTRKFEFQKLQKFQTSFLIVWSAKHPIQVLNPSLKTKNERFLRILSFFYVFSVLCQFLCVAHTTRNVSLMARNFLTYLIMGGVGKVLCHQKKIKMIWWKIKIIFAHIFT